MSVYTSVSFAELASYLEHYNVGALSHYEGISAGVENTNYFVDTDQGRYVLTLVESVSAEKLPFILGLVDHLAVNNLPCAQPIHLNSGELFGELNDKPAVLMNCLSGAPLTKPNNQQALVIGEALAKFHQLSSRLPVEEYSHIPQWCNELGAKLFEKLSKADQDFLSDALMATGEIDWTTLPAGPVHADLFPDNAMFDGNQLSGLIDFYHACSTPYLYDLCVTLNAWCFDEQLNQFDQDKAQQLLASYEDVRPLDPIEHALLPIMMQTAALRFWLSRLRDYHFPTAGEDVTQKAPEGKQRLLKGLIAGNFHIN
ncbi:homoserine kinase [Neptuniibacter caesariensis]|uniref:Homoserine kinase n=1 Tax=Neptuniibacter caesariensis TaxID=207954 RepID=A0A7U8C1C3_NEPCE|nr:homoserine kinase [Neptuniibacter caesariensis]EAR59633.1 ketohexokinase [Oceanospirillum sp. MED92] [Neptuniibacter caesariensis]